MLRIHSRETVGEEAVVAVTLAGEAPFQGVQSLDGIADCTLAAGDD